MKSKLKKLSAATFILLMSVGFYVNGQSLAGEALGSHGCTMKPEMNIGYCKQSVDECNWFCLRSAVEPKGARCSDH